MGTALAQKTDRHLAAILFSDIVGYSTLSHRDELLALRLLKEHREIVRPLLQKHRGREVKTMGDGFLAEFDNAAAATLCAVEIQRAHNDRNRARAEGELIRVRIGIHAGDVIASEGDIYGDGVNIASRLMTLANPGRICVSANVMDQVRQQIPHWVSVLGPRRLKGIKTEVHAFAICVEYEADEPPPWAARIKARFRRHARKLAAFGVLATAAIATWRFAPDSDSVFDGHRIAVAPLKPLGLPADHQHWSESIADELVSSLSKVDHISVLGINSTSKEMQLHQNPHEIGRELRVGGLVEGTVQQEGDPVRIRIRLTDTKSGESKWSEDFESSQAHIFELQRTIATKIAEKFTGRKATPASDAGAPTNGAAYLHYLHGLSLVRTRTSAGLHEGLAELEAAVKTDPSFAAAYSAIATTNILLNFYGYLPPDRATAAGEAAAQKALALDPNNSDALLWFADKYGYYIRDPELANSFFQRAIEANPSSSLAYNWYGQYLAITARYAGARTYFTRALELDPLSQVAIAATSLPDYYEGHYDKALEILESALKADPNSAVAHRYLGRIHLARKDYAKAEASLRAASAQSKGSLEIDALLVQALLGAGKTAEARALWKDVLARARTNFSPHYFLGRAYLAFGDTAKSLSELELANRKRENQALIMAKDPLLLGLRGNERFEKLLREVQSGDDKAALLKKTR